MRASPPLEVALNHFGRWQSAIAVLGLASAAVVIAWLVLVRDQQSGAVLVAAALGAIAIVAMALRTARIGPFVLAWDGQRWQLTAPASGWREPVAGSLQVAIDLGAWMLLRFVADGTAPRRRVTWVPVQRHGLEAQWHRLRCAVHSPQPSADGP